jgi:signal transduction histidine kinase
LNINTLLHDIRNPLNAIAMNAELAKLILQTNGDATKALIALETILKNCQACSEQLSLLKQQLDAVNLTTPAEPD